MATTPVTKIRRTRATTIVTPQVVSAVKTTPILNSKPHTQIAKVHITADAVKKPDNLARLMNQIQTNNDQATVGARTNPMNAGGVIVKQQAFTAGMAKLVRHNLGRVPVGYEVIRSQNVSAGTTGQYAGLWNGDADAGFITSTGAAGTFTLVPWTHAEPTNGATASTGAGTITIATAGTYFLACFIFFQANTAGDQIEAAVFVNGVRATDFTGIERTALSGTVSVLVGLAVITGLHTFAANDVIDVRIADNTIGFAQTTINASNLMVHGVTAAGGGITVGETALPVGEDASQSLNLIPSATGTADLFVF